MAESSAWPQSVAFPPLDLSGHTPKLKHRNVVGEGDAGWKNTGRSKANHWASSVPAAVSSHRAVGARRGRGQNRAHCYAAAAEALRRILLDHAKARGREKRGGGRKRVPLSVADIADSWSFQETLSLDEALRRLMDRDPNIGRVVQLRFFTGLSIDDTAKALGVSAATVTPRWEFGRTGLYRELPREKTQD